MDDINTSYGEWCKRIAESRGVGELIAHFREHVYEHFDRHNREGELRAYLYRQILNLFFS